jgi:hypothetical protein
MVYKYLDLDAPVKMSPDKFPYHCFADFVEIPGESLNPNAFPSRTYEVNSKNQSVFTMVQKKGLRLSTPMDFLQRRCPKVGCARIIVLRIPGEIIHLRERCHLPGGATTKQNTNQGGKCPNTKKSKNHLSTPPKKQECNTRKIISLRGICICKEEHWHKTPLAWKPNIHKPQARKERKKNF